MAIQDPNKVIAVTAAGQPCRLIVRWVFLIMAGMVSVICMSLLFIVDSSYVVFRVICAMFILYYDLAYKNRKQIMHFHSPFFNINIEDTMLISG